ncbi:MAG: transposase-like protein [Arenicella sp.]|jgi:transposase-like protein
MRSKTGGTFCPEFRLELANAVDENYSIRKATLALGVGHSTMDKLVRRLRLRLNGQMPKASVMTPEHKLIKESEKRIRDIEEQNARLKNATSLLMSDFLKDFNFTRSRFNAMVKSFHNLNKGWAGARRIIDIVTSLGLPLSRYRAQGVIKRLSLVCSQLPKHRYVRRPRKLTA